MSLEAEDRALLRLSVAIVRGDWDALRNVRRDAGEGAPGRAWREATLQAHLFAGFPRVVEAFAILAEEGGLGPLDPDEVRREPDRFEEGIALFERIYAGASSSVRASLAAGHPDLEAWILGHAYGRVLARPGLSPRKRELYSVACLIALGQERQLASHVRGALRCGATREDLDQVLRELELFLPGDLVTPARRIVARFAE